MARKAAIHSASPKRRLAAVDQLSLLLLASPKSMRLPAAETAAPACDGQHRKAVGALRTFAFEAFHALQHADPPSGEYDEKLDAGEAAGVVSTSTEENWQAVDDWLHGAG